MRSCVLHTSLKCWKCAVGMWGHCSHLGLAAVQCSGSLMLVSFCPCQCLSAQQLCFSSQFISLSPRCGARNGAPPGSGQRLSGEGRNCQGSEAYRFVAALCNEFCWCVQIERERVIMRDRPIVKGAGDCGLSTGKNSQLTHVTLASCTRSAETQTGAACSGRK
jgi:hypothetical protein